MALKSADLVIKTFNPAGLRDVPGHQEIEIGLVKLYRVTGDRKYLDQAFFFLDQRGRHETRKSYEDYAQDHKPVAEQTEAVGHSVRAAYMYTAMADVAALTGNVGYKRALDRLWDNVVGRKLYLTGGIGATGATEGFGADYDLPNSAYAETCASIANALWNYRMFLLEQDARYIDIYERAVYNAMLSGLSLQGDTFFYPNPLLSNGQHQRSPWFTCACCPSNLPRFMMSLPGNAYATSGDKVFVNLFVQGTARITRAGGDVTLEQTTNYPWDGDVRVRVAAGTPGRMTLMLRVPGWARQQPVPGDLYRHLEAAVGTRHAVGQRRAGARDARQGLRRRDARLEGRRRGPARVADEHPARGRASVGEGRCRAGGHRARSARLCRRVGRSQRARDESRAGRYGAADGRGAARVVRRCDDDHGEGDRAEAAGWSRGQPVCAIDPHPVLRLVTPREGRDGSVAGAGRRESDARTRNAGPVCVTPVDVYGRWDESRP